MQVQTLSSNRMEWVDAMRGFSMIVVVLGHVLMYMDLGGYNSFISSLFLTFRMPLFFFVSGFFSFRALNWWTFPKVSDIIKRKIQAQIICTFVFLFIYQLVFDGSIKGVYDGFGGYWFTIVLFQMYLCYLILSLLSRIIKRNITFISLIIISILALAIHQMYHGENRLWIILTWSSLTKYFQFFALGIICARFKDFFFSLIKNSAFRGAMIAGWVICLLLWYNNSFHTDFPFAYSLVHDLIIRYFALMTVIIIFSSSEKQIVSTRHGKHLQFIGRRTLDIYMIHFFLLPDLQFLYLYLTEGNMFVIQLLVSGIVTLIIVVLCLVISGILRKSHYLGEWLFGIKPQTKLIE